MRPLPSRADILARRRLAEAIEADIAVIENLIELASKAIPALHGGDAIGHVENARSELLAAVTGLRDEMPPEEGDDGNDGAREVTAKESMWAYLDSMKGGR